MFTHRQVRLILILMLVLSIGGMASGDTGDDNNTEAQAVTIAAKETVTGVVNPSDPFDFFTIDIPDDSEISGTLTFSSTQPSTVLRVYNGLTKERVVDDKPTTDTVKSYNWTLDTDTLEPGVYFFRVFFWSAAAYDHDYTLTLDLEITSTSEPPGGLHVFRPELRVDLSKGLKFEKEDRPTLGFNPVNIAVSPWPMLTGPVDNSRRSRASAPAGGMVELQSVDLFDKVLTWVEHVSPANPMSSGYDVTHTVMAYDRKPAFSRFLVGPRGMVYFRYLAAYPYAFFYGYDLDAGQQWNCQGIETGFLDSLGNVYFDFGGYVARVYSYDDTGEQRWMAAFDDYGHYMKVFSVGRSVYAGGMKYETWEGEELGRHITSLSLEGDEHWTAGPFDNGPSEMAEDASGNLYVRTFYDEMFKIKPGGDVEWKIDLPSKEHSYHHEKYAFGPIPGNDGRVWLAAMLWSAEDAEPEYVGGVTPGEKIKVVPLLNGPVYEVINSNGTTFKYAKLGGDDKTPVAACYGSNGMLCLGFVDGTISGYENWNNMKWTWQISGMEKILQVVMDKDNYIYVLFTGWGIQAFGKAAYIAVIDSSNGNQVGFIKVGVPDEYCGADSWIAPGGDSTLIYLNTYGYLKVYGPILTIPITPERRLIGIK